MGLMKARFSRRRQLLLAVGLTLIVADGAFVAAGLTLGAFGGAVGGVALSLLAVVLGLISLARQKGTEGALVSPYHVRLIATAVIAAAVAAAAGLALSHVLPTPRWVPFVLGFALGAVPTLYIMLRGRTVRL